MITQLYTNQSISYIASLCTLLNQLEELGPECSTKESTFVRMCNLKFDFDIVPLKTDSTVI